MKIYCQECGTPIEYISKKPNFCGNCGYNFITEAKNSPPSQESKASLGDDPEENDVKELDPRIYEMQGLEVDIIRNKAPELTLGDLFPEVSQEGDEKQKRSK